MNLRKKNRLLILILIFPLLAGAQEFRHRAPLDTVRNAGFYAIPISPDLSSYLKKDYSDIRITDGDGQWIPHILSKPYENVAVEFVHKDLPLIKNETTGGKTIVIIENGGKLELNDLSLTIKNVAVRRFAAFSGSEDTLNWFTISDSILLQDPENIDDNKVAFEFSFPKVSYAYYRLIIDNEGNDPVNIESVSTYAPPQPETVKKYIPNPPSMITQRDSAGYSVVTVNNDKDFHFSLLRIQVKSPKFYQRKVSLYVTPRENARAFLQAPPVVELVLTSNGTGEYAVPLLDSRTFYLVIANGDNPPLAISSISTEQENKQLVAYLEKDKEYELLFDDSLATAAVYDLKQFQGSIPKNPAVLNIGNIEMTAAGAAAGSGKVSRTWIWPVIILVIFLLGYFTWQLSLDLKKKN